MEHVAAVKTASAGLPTGPTHQIERRLGLFPLFFYQFLPDRLPIAEFDAVCPLVESIVPGLALKEPSWPNRSAEFISETRRNPIRLGLHPSVDLLTVASRRCHRGDGR
jgi:hypothetical protein